MKLKYYLRGLGCGILLATVVLVLSGRERSKVEVEKLTDDEIISRAEDLGMVMNNSSGIDYNSILDSISGDENTETKDSEANVEESEDGTKESDSSKDSKDNSQDSEDTSNQISDEASGEDIKNEDSVKDLASDQEDSDANKDTDSVATIESVGITITNGMKAQEVSDLLEDAGLVIDGDDFRRYLSSHQLTTKLRSGKFTIPQGSDYDQIARIITRK